MKTFIALGMMLLLVTTSVAVPQPPLKGPNSWGPSWIGGAPAGGNPRPKNLDKSRTAMTINDDGSVIGVAVRLWVDAEVQKGNKYELVYQLRVHTKKGEAGAILGTVDKPNGIVYTVASWLADDAWNGMEGDADINRRDLTGMKNLPLDKLVTIRVEPHLYDPKTDKYLTPSKTKAIIILAAVNEFGRVTSVISLRSWIVSSAQHHADEVLNRLADLDDYDLYGNKIGDAIGQVLINKEIPSQIKAKFIRAVPKEVVNIKDSTVLWTVLKDFAAGGDSDLQTAAKEKLEQK